MKLDSSLPIRKMGRQYVVYRLDPLTKERSMIVLNDTAAFLWQKFSGCPSFTVADLAETLVAEYDIDLRTATEDATSLANAWVDDGVAML